MFSWCKTCATEPAGSGFLVQKEKEPPKFYPKFTDIKEADLRDLKTSVLKINKSQYDAFSKNLTGKESKFVDQDFPPNDKSLGFFENVKTDKWKRISEIVQSATYFNKQISPADGVTSNNTYNFGYQAALAALAQRPQRLKSLINASNISPSGIYTFLLRHNGSVQEVIIDDYVPVDEKGDPLFAKHHEGSVWTLLLEKARSKLHGSYEQMIKHSQSVRNPLQEITFAPTDIIKHANINKDDHWSKLVQNTQKDYILLGLTSASDKINWASINLTANHYYTILDAANLTHKLGSKFKVLKLRNAFKHEQYKGQGSLTDTLFWDQIENSDEKSRLISSQDSKQGIIYMLYSDYLKYFEQTAINYYEPFRNYFHYPCEFVSPNGLVYDFTISKQGFYSFIIDQNAMQTQQKGVEYIEEGWSRATILLIRDGTTKDAESYEYINGVLKYNEQYAHLRANIAPGKYILYVKLQSTIKNNNFPALVNLVTFSTQTIQLRQTLQQNYPNLLKKTFLDHGKWNKRQLYNNDLMWSSWKLVTQGGYAYIAFGNSSESQSKFVITFKEEVINQQNYILKKPFKGKGQQTLEILPGQQEIILLRIKNSEIKEINFPPPIDLQILPV